MTTDSSTSSLPAFACRVGCGACCIALSISSPIPGMPQGKPAGVRCVQLTDDNLCKLFGLPERPLVCDRLIPMEEMCGRTFDDAMIYLTALEIATKPEKEPVSQSAYQPTASG